MTEYSSSSDVRRGIISDRTFGQKQLIYSVVDDLAIFEGDIVLGTAEELASLPQQSAEDTQRSKVLGTRGIVTTGRLWADGVIPYTIDPNLSNLERVKGAIQHWSQYTPIRFVERTNQSGYVTFRPRNGVCSSNIGYTGGQQHINLGDGCDLGVAIHEIGHTVGLWHEQSREDRDRFVRILYENIEEGKEDNFDQRIREGDDIGLYDYGSIMHYSAYAFSKNRKPTIEVLQSGQEIGQRNGLSIGDISTVASVYTSNLAAKHSGKVLDVAEGNTEDGATIIQWSKSGGDNQKWQLKPAGDGYYYVVVQHSGKVLDVADGSTEDGATIIQWSEAGSDNQKWQLEHSGDGYYYLVAKHSGKVLDVADSNTEDGATIIQWSKSGSDNQKWKLANPAIS